MNWIDKTIFIGDNLHVMRGMNSDSVDLIYLDPPFNSNRNYAAPIGSQAAGAAFKDTWTLNDIDIAEHGELAEQAPALHTVIQAARESTWEGYAELPHHDVHPLTGDGSASSRVRGAFISTATQRLRHYLKLVMDSSLWKQVIFRNEITWKRTS